MRKKLTIILIAICVIVAGWIYFKPRVSALLKPEVRIKTLAFHQIGEEEILAELDVVVYNPTKKGFTTHRLDYMLSIKGEDIVTENDNKSVEVLPGDSALVKLPLKIDASKLRKVLREMEQEKEDSTDVVLTVSLTVDVPVAGIRQFHVVRSWRLPVLLPIRLKVTDSDLESWRLKRSHLSIRTEIENQNVFPVTLRDVKVHMNVGNDLVWEAEAHGIVVVAAHSVAPVDFQLVVKNGEAVETLFKSIFKDDKTSIAITFEGEVVSNDPKANGAKIVASRQGTLADLKKWRKK
jgi:LEA14-like dessication related protein